MVEEALKKLSRRWKKETTRLEGEKDPRILRKPYLVEKMNL